MLYTNYINLVPTDKINWNFTDSLILFVIFFGEGLNLWNNTKYEDFGETFAETIHFQIRA